MALWHVKLTVCIFILPLKLFSHEVWLRENLRECLRVVDEALSGCDILLNKRKKFFLFFELLLKHTLLLGEKLELVESLLLLAINFCKIVSARVLY